MNFSSFLPSRVLLWRRKMNVSCIHMWRFSPWVSEQFFFHVAWWMESFLYRTEMMFTFGWEWMDLLWCEHRQLSYFLQRRLKSIFVFEHRRSQFASVRTSKGLRDFWSVRRNVKTQKVLTEINKLALWSKAMKFDSLRGFVGAKILINRRVVESYKHEGGRKEFLASFGGNNYSHN